MKKDDLILVTDMQNVYLKGQEWACLDTEGTAKRILSVIDKADRDQVIFTKFLASEKPEGAWCDYNRKYEQINKDPWLNDLVQDLKDVSGKYRICTKSVYSSVNIPAVREAARKAGRVVLTGVVAECCVLFTAVDLIDLGCHVVYLTDGVSGLDEEKEKAAVLTLQGLSPVHTQIMTVEEYLEEE